MSCPDCGARVSARAVTCAQCGAPLDDDEQTAEPAGSHSRNTYVLLAILPALFGVTGVHNMYARHTSRGVTQLLMTVLSCWILWLPVFIWSIVEACSVTHDGDGAAMV